MDSIFRLNGRSYAFVGHGDLVRVAETRLRENAEADGYEVHWLAPDSTEPYRESRLEVFRYEFQQLRMLVEKRLRETNGTLYEGPRSFYYLGALEPFIPEEEYDDILRIARVARYSGICIGVRIAKSDVQEWLGVPVYTGRMMSGMMTWERQNPGELP